MKITFVKPFLSIKKCPDCDLPPFTVITGRNGAGKSHFLNALRQGFLTVDTAPNHEQEILYYDWRSLAPQGPGTPENGHGDMQVRHNSYKRFEQQRRRALQQFELRTHDISAAIGQLNNGRDIAAITEDEITIVLNSKELAHDYSARITEALTEAWISSSVADRHDQPYRNLVESVRAQCFRKLFSISEAEFLSVPQPSWGEVNLFQQLFGRLFVTYRNLKLENDLKLHRAQNERSENSYTLSNEQFRQKYGVPPWDLANEVFLLTGLDFTINSPDQYYYYDYTPKLYKRSSGAEVNFNELSSGEQILMSFAFCTYYSQDFRQISKLPKLLLLDEVDAPLHPSMCRSLLRVIIETIVNQHGVHVILATHSASTVALAPETSLFVMRADEPGIHKVTKSRALDELTDGVPTLSINYEGRRQVFVESPIDAEIYSSLYQRLRARLVSERSLEFLATGENADRRCGKDQVKYIVDALATSGNKSVLGLIDWDCCNESSDRLVVAVEGSRYGLENCVYDPLLLAAAAFRESKIRLRLKLEEFGSYTSLQSLSIQSRQTIVSVIQAAVLPSLGSNMQRVLVEYVGDFKLEVAGEYLRMQSHDLERHILEAFPEFRSIAKHSGDLMRHIVNNVVDDYPSFVPSALVQLFSDLLQRSLL